MCGLPLLSVLSVMLVAVGGDEVDERLGMQVAIDVPAGVDLFQVFDPDLEPARGSTGTALLFAPEGAHSDSEWLLVTCRSRGEGETDFDAPLSGLLGQPIETIDGADVLIAVAEPEYAPHARVAIALPRRAEHIISVATSVDDHELVSAASDALDSSFNDDCDVISETDLSEGWTLMLRRRTADAPAGYLGDAMLSMDRTSVFWRGAHSDQSIGLGSTAVTPADDDLTRAMEFFAPSGSETERITFRDSAALRGRSDQIEFVM